MRVVTDVTYYYESKSIIHSKQGSQQGSAIDNILPVLVSFSRAVRASATRKYVI